MKITILTLFPQMFQGPFDHSIVKNAIKNGAVKIELQNIRDNGLGKHQIVDDTPYGGGIGMVMRADVLKAAIEKAKGQNTNQQKEKQKIVLLSAGGIPFTQRKAEEYAILDHLILICGHYEGIDERMKKYIDEELSTGDYVVTGGEIPAMLVTDAVTRLVKGVLKSGASDNESFSLKGEGGEKYLEYPHYTKPQEFDGMSVPEVLLSGNHKKIEEWRMQAARNKTQDVRPDLLKKIEEKNTR